MMLNRLHQPTDMRRRRAARREAVGAALVTSLLLLTVLTLMGITALTNTRLELFMTRNHRHGTAILHLAEAGLEHAREVLRRHNAMSQEPSSFTDELRRAAGPNNVIDGFIRGTDDVPLVPVTTAPLGRASGTYVVYVSNDLADQRATLMDSNGRVTLTAVAMSPGGARRIIVGEVVRAAGPDIIATIYAKDHVTLDGAAGIRIDGHDNCLQALARPPIYTRSPALTAHQPQTTLLGQPALPQEGLQDIDILAHLKHLQSGAPSLVVLTNDQVGAAFGAPAHYLSVYADATRAFDPSGLRLANVTGYGILLVAGDLTVSGNFEWNGLILVSGHLTLVGGGGEINIRGAVLTHGSTVVTGSIDIRFDSCAIHRALSYQALSTVSWKEMYQ